MSNDSSAHLATLPQVWREIATRAEAGQSLPETEVVALVAGITAAVEAGDSIDAILGIKGRRGRRTAAWRRRETQRNGALRAWAGLHLPGLSRRQQALEMARRARCYATTTWQRVDQFRLACPESYVGTESEHLFQIFRTGLPMPSERHLREILKCESGAAAKVGNE